MNRRSGRDRHRHAQPGPGGQVFATQPRHVVARGHHAIDRADALAAAPDVLPGFLLRTFATVEARAIDAQKQAIVDANSDDIVYSNLFTGVHGNYLKPSIRNAGLDPDNLPVSDPSVMNFGGGGESAKKKAWKDIWGCGQGIGAVDGVLTTRDYVARLRGEYLAARARLGLALPVAV